MNITIHRVINECLEDLVNLSEMDAARLARYRAHNPTRLVTPIYFDANAGLVYAFQGYADHGGTRWGIMGKRISLPAVAVPLCDLHIIRPLWFD